MEKVKNKEEISKILEELLIVFGKRKLDEKNQKQYSKDIAEITKRLEKIAEFQKVQLKEELGKDYEEIDFSLYSEKDNNLGGYRTNIIFDENTNSLRKIPQNHQIRLNIYNISKYLTSCEESTRKLGCIKMIDTIFHEFKHFKQNCDMHSPILNIDAIKMSKQDIIQRLKYDEVYRQNYWNMSKEINARLTAYDKTMEVLNAVTGVEKEYLKDLYQRNADIHLDKARENASLFKEGKEGLQQDKDSFFTNRVDEFIQANPDVLEIYKSLQFEYNMDGKKKSNLQLIEELKIHLRNIRNDNNLSQENKRNEGRRVRNTYFDILEERLKDITRDEAIEFEKACGIEGKGGTKTFYDLMKEHYIETYNRKISDIDKLQEMVKGKKGTLGIEDNFDAQRKIIEEKYKRLLQTVSNLRESVYRTENKAINGVDIGYVAPIQLSCDQQQIRNKTIKKLIETYEKLESDQEFKKRETLEYKYINQVINAVGLQRCSIGFTKSFELGKRHSIKAEEPTIVTPAEIEPQELSNIFNNFKI